MNEFQLNSPSPKPSSSSRTDKGQSAPEKTDPPNAESFKDVLKSAVQKSGGSGEIRQDLVNKYKSTLADGSYEVKAKELAEKMVQKIRDNKTRAII